MKTSKVYKLFLLIAIVSLSLSGIAQNNNEVFTVVEESPSFIGGDAAMSQFMVKNLQYPAEALEKNIQGTVYISFIVEPDGAISNILIKRDIGSGCGTEAMRVVKSMPNWKPGKQRGKTVRTQMMLPVSFKLS